MLSLKIPTPWRQCSTSQQAWKIPFDVEAAGNVTPVQEGNLYHEEMSKGVLHHSRWGRFLCSTDTTDGCPTSQWLKRLQTVLQACEVRPGRSLQYCVTNVRDERDCGWGVYGGHAPRPWWFAQSLAAPQAEMPSMTSEYPVQKPSNSSSIYKNPQPKSIKLCHIQKMLLVLMTIVFLFFLVYFQCQQYQIINTHLTMQNIHNNAEQKYWDVRSFLLFSILMTVFSAPTTHWTDVVVTERSMFNFLFLIFSCKHMFIKLH